ncbi:MAG: hypothetical protein Unbinned7913contig1002_27 [Prokaryotic dsDNA virus sp.]|jgi:hypothetical protein|nr:MAG: hypothetical protein Unbinned7913contig1002_27 [Prokaryotic dsDNA virus sp.]
MSDPGIIAGVAAAVVGAVANKVLNPSPDPPAITKDDIVTYDEDGYISSERYFDEESNQWVSREYNQKSGWERERELAIERGASEEELSSIQGRITEAQGVLDEESAERERVRLEEERRRQEEAAFRAEQSGLRTEFQSRLTQYADYDPDAQVEDYENYGNTFYENMKGRLDDEFADVKRETEEDVSRRNMIGSSFHKDRLREIQDEYDEEHQNIIERTELIKKELYDSDRGFYADMNERNRAYTLNALSRIDAATDAASLRDLRFGAQELDRDYNTARIDYLGSQQARASSDAATQMALNYQSTTMNKWQQDMANYRTEQTNIMNASTGLAHLYGRETSRTPGTPTNVSSQRGNQGVDFGNFSNYRDYWYRLNTPQPEYRANQAYLL